VAAFGLFVKPIWKSAKHLLESPSLHRYRARAIRLSVIFLAIVLGGGFFVPMPLRTQTEGVVWLPDQALVRAGVSGTFQRWLVEPGSQVSKGSALLMMDDPQLVSELEVARAKVAESGARYNVEQFSNPVQAGVLLQQLEYEKNALEQVNERYEHLIVYSEIEGVLTVPKSQDMIGQHFKKGELLGYVMDRKQLVARVAVAQDNIDLVRTRFKAVELRFADSISSSYQVAVLREIPSALNKLPTAALSPNGGGKIPVDPNDSEGLKTLDRVFFVDLSLPPEAIPDAFGGRVYVRFDHIGEPLLGQMYRRLRQLFLSRFHV
jgi:putative peptide zinc metalloprotease protein